MNKVIFGIMNIFILVQSLTGVFAETASAATFRMTFGDQSRPGSSEYHLLTTGQNGMAAYRAVGFTNDMNCRGKFAYWRLCETAIDSESSRPTRSNSQRRRCLGPHLLSKAHERFDGKLTYDLEPNFIGFFDKSLDFRIR